MAANGFLGNDPQDMQILISNLNTAIEQIQGAMNLVDGKVQSVQWNGTDADNFRNSEWPNSKSQLTKVITDLGVARDTVQRQKSEQEQASGS